MRILILMAVVASVFTTGVAFACEPIAEPKPWYARGLAQFVAAVVAPRADATEVFADMVVGRNDAETMPPGPIVLVPWSFGADCKPLVWDQTRDGIWSPPNSPAFYTGRLRNRDAWVSGLPTIDIEMARLQPVWHGGERDVNAMERRPSYS